MGYFSVLLNYDWEKTTSPSGHVQWTPTADSNADQAPMAHAPSKRQALMMTTADMALKLDPDYAKISQHFYENPEEFAQAYAEAWFKLTHRDMGPVSRYLGDEVPNQTFVWQDPLPQTPAALASNDDVDALKQAIVASGLSVSDLVSIAWASASTYRDTDKRGGANGARINLSPQKEWEVNTLSNTASTIETLEKIRQEYSGTAISLADLIVLAGCVGIEQACDGRCAVAFTPGRTDATQEQTDSESIAVLEPTFDGFRNYKNTQDPRSTEALMIEKASLMGLSASEMTVLVGGLRVLGVNAGSSPNGVFTDKVGKLSNDFFTNLLASDTTWSATDDSKEVYEGHDSESNKVKWTATRADLVFGSNSILRGIAEIYAYSDANDQFRTDFINAWTKVMNADRFDIKS